MVRRVTATRRSALLRDERVALTADLDIHRSSHLFIQFYGDEATARAREIVEQMRRKGDNEGADTWPRIIVAIGELGDPPSDARY